MPEVAVSGDAHNVECVIKVGSTSHEIFIRSPSPLLHPTGDVGVALGVLAAMRVGEPLTIHGPVNATLLKNMARFQEIFATWDPELTPVAISSDASSPTQPGQAVGTFFSGGVDSFFTAWKHRAVITDWITVLGFDIPLADQNLWSATRDAVAAAASAAGTRLVEVHTNVRECSEQILPWEMFHGTALAAVGLALRQHLGTLFIPSSHHYTNLAPWGSHPLLDPLWGGDGFHVDHDGADRTRVEKVRAISEWPLAMKYLRVCWVNVPNQYNCGQCEKCLRTMVNLYAVGALSRCETLPDRLDPRAVGNLLVRSDENVRSFVRENLEAIPHTPATAPLRRALKRSIGLNIPYRARRRLVRLIRK